MNLSGSVERALVWMLWNFSESRFFCLSFSLGFFECSHFPLLCVYVWSSARVPSWAGKEWLTLIRLGKNFASGFFLWGPFVTGNSSVCSVFEIRGLALHFYWVRYCCNICVLWWKSNFTTYAKRPPYQMFSNVSQSKHFPVSLFPKLDLDSLLIMTLCDFNVVLPTV